MRKIMLLMLTAVTMLAVGTPAKAQRRKAAAIRRTVQSYVKNPVLVRDMDNVSVYSGKQAGFVVVSKVEKMPAVLGYGDAAYNDIDMPDGMTWLLNYYNTISASVESGKVKAPKIIAPPAPVDTLIRTEWAQNTPFWDMLPTVTNQKTQKVDTLVVGCVATSVSQLMYYHRWPDETAVGYPTGIIDYTNKTKDGQTQQIYADLSTSKYDWDSMGLMYGLDRTEDQKSRDAVALLCRDVAYACKSNMDIIAADGTGSTPSKAAHALVHNFGYDKGIRLEFASDYSEEEWAEKLYNELSNGRPVQYNGMMSGMRGGHAFILDGVNKEGYYHVNWGWRGKQNDYFLISSLNPDHPDIGSGDVGDGGYNLSQQALFGFQKPVEGSVCIPYNLTLYSIKVSQCENDVVKEIYCDIENDGWDDFEGKLYARLVNAETGVEYDTLFVEDTNITKYYDDSFKYVKKYSIKDTFDVPEGKYHLEVYSTDNNGNTFKCRREYKWKYYVNIKDKKMYLVYPEVTLKNVTCTKIDDPDHELTLKIDMDIVNNTNQIIPGDRLDLYIGSVGDIMGEGTDNADVNFNLLLPDSVYHWSTDSISKYIEFLFAPSQLRIQILSIDGNHIYYDTGLVDTDTALSTGIIAVKKKDDDAIQPAYNLSGQRVAEDAKGIVLRRGKKIIVR